MMRTNEFKRDVSKTLSPKPIREGFKTVLRKTPDVKLSYSILGVRSAVGKLMHDYQGYILGMQLNSTMKAKGIDALGDLLHHAINVAKVLKVKAPSSQRKIKPKNTHTFLLTEIDRVSSEMLDTLYSSIAAAHMAPMTEAEIEAAKARAAKAPKKSDKPVVEKVYQKPVAHPVDVEKIKGHVALIFQYVYEFSWAMYNEPVAKVMEQHIEKLKPSFPKDFFAPPPKKPAPAKPIKKAEAPAT